MTHLPPEEFLAVLAHKGIQLSVEGERLRFRAPAGAMTADLRTTIAEHKSALLAMARERPDVIGPNGISPGAAEPNPDSDPLGGVEQIIAAPRTRSMPLSYEERRLWMVHQQLSKPEAYNVTIAVRLRGTLDLARLRGAYATVMQRHEILRTAYLEQGGEPSRAVFQDVPVPFTVESLGNLPDARRDAVLAKRIAEVVRLPFDLTRAPLFRVLTLELGAGDHALVTVIHHVIFDEWSAELLQSEVAAAYEGAQSTRGLPHLTVQYADYAAWQHARTAKQGMRRHRDYWRKSLKGASAHLDLPVDRALPANATGRGDWYQFDFPPAIVASMEKIGRQEGATSFVVWLAAFAALLTRITGQNDLVIATPFTQRQRPELQKVIGFFLNTLPLRFRAEPDDDFRTLVRTTRAAVLDGFEHGELPLDEIIAEGEVPRSRSLPGLFPVMFVLQPRNGPAVSLPGVAVEKIATSTDSAKAFLTLFLRQGNLGNLAGTFEYSTEVFDRETIVRLVEQLHCLVEAAARAPDAPIAALPILSATQRQQLLTAFNPAPAEYPRDATVHGLFAERCRETPDAAAIIEDGETISYRTLSERADEVARRLRDVGVTTGERVSVLVDRSATFVVAVLGVLKAGAAYVPLNRDFPTQRLAFIIKDCNSRVVLTHGTPPEGVARDDLIVLDLAVDTTGCESGQSPRTVTRPQLASQDSCGNRMSTIAVEASDTVVLSDLSAAEAPEARIHPTAESPAYVMYTSGSTGQPKGVVIPHRGIIRLVQGQSYASFARDERFMFLASPAFDASTFELWGALLNGASCVVFPEKWPDFDQLEAAIRRHGVTCLWLTAGLFNQIIDRRPETLATVRHVLTGGEALSVPHVRRALQLLPNLRLTNGYGPTESTTFACTYEVPRERNDWNASVPIGRPLAHTRCHILDARRQSVPIGVPGELYIGGDGLALEYLNHPELTREKFVSDPFSTEPGARLYRTGDRCRWLADGTIEFLGRLDDQIKLRGFRIELGEIESVLSEHPLVLQAAVAVQTATSGAQTLQAFVVTRNEAMISGDELRDWLMGQLPEYMVPSAFAAVERLPLSVNGKVDRRALLTEARCELGNADEFVGPRNDAERVLANIWRMVLGRNEISVHHNFFEIGGTSLLAMQMVDEIRRRFYVPFPLAALFGVPTIDKLAKRLTEKQSGRSISESVVMRGTGPGSALFFVPGLAGYEFLPPAVVRRLRGERPFFDGLQVRGVDGLEPPADRVESIAADLVTQIQKVQPHGPYCLAGFCFAGLLAIEVARQLEAAGHTVSGVALWDAFPRRGWRFRVTQRAMRAMSDIREAPRRCAGIALRESRWLVRQAMQPFRAPRIPRPATQGHFSESTREVIKASFRAIEAYRPKPHRGPVLLARSKTPVPDPWKGILLGPTEVIDLSYRHTVLMQEPAISELADKTAAFLRQCDTVLTRPRSTEKG